MCLDPLMLLAVHKKTTNRQTHEVYGLTDND